MERAALSIPEFCATHGVSESWYYAKKKTGETPPEIRVGGRRLIDATEAAKWRQRRQEQAKPQFSPEVLAAKAALDANIEARNAALAVHAQAQALVDAADRAIADGRAIEEQIAALEQRRTAALLAERTGEPHDERAADVADQLARLRSESAPLLERAAEDRALLPLLQRRVEEAYKPVAELVGAVPALRYAIVKALAEHDLRAQERDAAAPYYRTHCDRRSAEYIAAQLNPARVPQLPVLRGTVPFAAGIQENGEPFVLRPETEIPAAEARVWAMLGELGMER